MDNLVWDPASLSKADYTTFALFNRQGSNRLLPNFRDSVADIAKISYFSIDNDSCFTGYTIKEDWVKSYQISKNDVWENYTDLSYWREQFLQQWDKVHLSSMMSSDLSPEFSEVSMTHFINESGEIIVANQKNEADFRKLGWSPLPRDVVDKLCDVCGGVGKSDGEECWHCEGERLDPTK